MASYGLEDSHENFNEDGESRSLRVTKKLVIPSLMLPKALNSSNIVNSHPLEAPHPPKPSLHHFQSYTGPSTSNFFRLLVVGPSDFRRSSTEQVEPPIPLSNRVKKDLDEVVSKATASKHTHTDVSVPIHRDTRSEGSWKQFKAEWEARWEDAYSSQRQNHCSREVGSHPDSEEGLLRTVRIRTADPLSHVRSSTRRARKQSRLKRSSLARPYSSSSSSPVPATSPSLPPSSAFPSTMPSSSSLSDLSFLTADEIPDTPSRPPIPLVVAFPFPSTTVSLYPPPSRNSSRARSRGVTPGSICPYRASEKCSSSHATPFLLDLNTGRFEALRFPDSLLVLSFSILAPLRAHMRSATQWLLSMPLKAAGAFNEVGTNEDQMLDDTLMDSVDSVDTINNDHTKSSSSSSSIASARDSGQQVSCSLEGSYWDSLLII
ncbi:hypothetical protein EV360DRAFT_83015 [Lentinula raphanica]|nr:hypothetical protein EV360DRAFT_83015 [Lentinula raphanica]